MSRFYKFHRRIRSPQTGPTSWLDLNKVVPLPPLPLLARLSHWRWRNCKEAGVDCAASGAAEPRALWESKTGSGLWAGTVFPSYSLRSPSVSLCLHVHQEQAHTRQPTTGNLQRQNSRPSPFLEKWARKRLQREMFQHLNQFRFMLFFLFYSSWHSCFFQRLNIHRMCLGTFVVAVSCVLVDFIHRWSEFVFTKWRNTSPSQTSWCLNSHVWAIFPATIKTMLNCWYCFLMKEWKWSHWPHWSQQI